MSEMIRNITCSAASLGIPSVPGEESYTQRVKDFPIDLDLYLKLKGIAKCYGVTKEFKDVIDYFKVPGGETPAGFRIELGLAADGVLRYDLVRDISYDKNGQKRVTNLLFSADSANPYEIAPCAGLLANLTCNPGIVYDLFINNPKANIGNKFKDRDEVMAEIGRVLGPGCDISVELNNPFEPDFGKILEEAEKFREMLSKWRVVIKVPHTGPVNGENVQQLLSGDKKLNKRWYEPTTEDAFRGHNLALKLHEKGYRINFTLMFDPHQTALALQAKPYFINSFVRHRMSQSAAMKQYLDMFDATGDEAWLKTLRTFLVDKDYLASGDAEFDLKACEAMARQLLSYRKYSEPEGMDGLDSVRHNLRMLRQCNLPDTRLIICSMEGERNYPEIDLLMADPEFEDMIGKVVITAEPGYLARFSSSNQVVSYQRRFMNAAKGMK